MWLWGELTGILTSPGREDNFRRSHIVPGRLRGRYVAPRSAPAAVIQRQFARAIRYTTVLTLIELC
jgi:hypothetical protein